METPRDFIEHERELSSWWYLARRDLLREFVSQALIKPLFVMVVTGIVYAVAMKIVASFWPPARDAIDYEAMKDEYDLFELDRSLLAERQG